MPERDIRLWSTLCHLSALCGLLIPYVGSAVGPLVVWLLKRHDHPAIDAAGKDALNFQISMLLYSGALWLVGIPLAFIFIGFLFFGLAVIVGLVALVLAVIAAVKVSNGGTFRYPFTIRFIA